MKCYLPFLPILSIPILVSFMMILFQVSSFNLVLEKYRLEDTYFTAQFI